MTPDEMMAAAANAGLDAVCITEHDRVWSEREARELSESHGLKVFRGMEVTTTGGDVLVFGIYEPPSGIMPPADLKQWVDNEGGLCVAAHPFRGFLLFGIGSMNLSLKDAASNPTFSYVHGLEVFNGLVTASENELAGKVADELGLIKVGGSDAHTVQAVGTCVMDFHDDIENESELIVAMKESRFDIRVRA
jgi:predicted metal-dependent phosphoesterase TrpH